MIQETRMMGTQYQNISRKFLGKGHSDSKCKGVTGGKLSTLRAIKYYK